METLGRIYAEVTSALCEQTIECGGQKFQPDDGTGYLDCRLSHAMVITHYGEALHPGTIANSFNSMLHKNVNLQHQLRAHDRAKIMKDRIVGCVAAVELLGGDGQSQNGKPRMDTNGHESNAGARLCEPQRARRPSVSNPVPHSIPCGTAAGRRRSLRIRVNSCPLVVSKSSNYPPSHTDGRGRKSSDW